MDRPREAEAGQEPVRPRQGAVVVVIAGSLALSILLVLVIGGAFAARLADDKPRAVSVTDTGPVTTTEPTPEVVLAPPVSIDNTTATAAPGG